MISPRHSKSPEKSRYSRHSDEGWKGKDGRSTSPSKGDESSTKLASPKPPSKPSLAQAIFDEFLVCKICLEGYKNPKCLECLHTFCEQCVDSHVSSESTYKKYSDYREFTCPLCRKRTQLPIGGVKKLPDNFLVSNLSEMVGRQRPSKFPFCDFCKLVDNKFREAHAKCLDCSKMLCPSCVSEHLDINVTRAHSIFDIDIEKDISCREHPDEMVRYYCEPCETCVCVVCTFKDHRQHKVTQFCEAVVVYRDVMRSLVGQCKTKIDNFDAHIASLTRCENIILDVRQKIRQTSAAFVEEIHERERLLLDELDTVYSTDCIEHIDKKADLSNQVESLRSTCKLAETILHGKDIELLLLRKDVQDKLTLLNKVDAKCLPQTVNKVVEFVCGTVDFGRLNDHDKPTPTTITVQKTDETINQNKVAVPAAGKSKKKNTDDQSTTTSNSTVDSDSDEDSDSDSSESSDSDDMLKQSPQSSNPKQIGRKMIHQSTMTDIVHLQDKAVNTKARSMRGSQTTVGDRNSCASPHAGTLSV